METIGIDTSLADGVDGVFFGRAFAQVFLAQDTLVKSITVWRPPGGGGNATPVRLFITETKSNPYALAPDTGAILVTGDTLSAPNPSDYPVPLRWDFDPPVSLPRRGHFAFAIKDDDQFCSGIFSFLVDSLETYEDGVAWRVSPTILCTMGAGVSPRPWDLVFTIEFCATPVPTLQQSWGRTKAMYR